MDEALHRIEPGQGIGSVRFGDSPEQVQGHLGPPEEIENLDQATMFWRYSALKLQFAFLSADWPSAAMDKRVVDFMTRHRATTLWGKRIIGRPENEVLDMFRERGCGSFTVSEETLGPLKYRIYRLEQLHVVLDFGDGMLRGLLWASRKHDDGITAPDESALRQP